MSRVATSPDLHVTGLNVQFVDRGKTFTAVSVDDLKAPGGASLALTGPSGCGKSTLLYALAGLLAPASGTLHWGAMDLLAQRESARDAWRRQNVGFVFQDFELLAELTPLQNVLMPATFAHFTIPAALKLRAQKLLDQFGVPARAGPTGVLSRGERQRVALSRALLFDPPIILADEPTASLDAQSGEIVIAALTEHARAEGRTVIAASHDPALIASMKARLSLDHGRIASYVEAAP
jgi:putative ABC transport system ATP-binding protein